MGEVLVVTTFHFGHSYLLLIFCIGTRYPGPVFEGGMNGPDFGPGGPRFPQFPNLPNLDMANPEMVRKEVIPNLIRYAEEGQASGRYTEEQFRTLMQQVSNNALPKDIV